MNTSSDRIASIYKSRTTITTLLDDQGYDMSKYASVSVGEIDAMTNNQQLDMHLHAEDGRKAYVKYFIYNKALRAQNIEDLVEQLYEVEGKLEKNDMLVVIADDSPTDNVVNTIKYLFDNKGIFVVLFSMKSLQFVVTHHVLVPPGRIMSNNEVDELKKRYNISTLRQLPEVSRFDPQSQALGVRPGEVCEYTRKSKTAGSALYYRVCV